uniref:Interferon-inducible GTPase 5-like n=1 Tax=Geotrypetes seraphini TaxID=260995 RepID=A0A6P8NID4_GEOSA|nr:interferon-inducible GTPase 5-like [Geotrypetes seraphini]
MAVTEPSTAYGMLPQLSDVMDLIETGDITAAASKIMKTWESVESAQLNIAITGAVRSGKSTFVNAIRDLGDKEEGSAVTGVKETTVTPTPHFHPKNPNITFWDLPRIGSRNFQAQEYLEQVNFEQYDFFIIIASGRFKSSHAELARAIQKKGKKFYFVRTKVDADLRLSKRYCKCTFNERKILNRIKKKCIKSLEKKGVGSPEVFLISSRELKKYDFQQLVETLEPELPTIKRQVFLLYLPNISAAVLAKKKEILQGHIWKLALVSCAGAVIPVPGLSVVCDVNVLVKPLSNYREAFGLDEKSLAKLAKKINKPIHSLKAVIKSPVAHEMSANIIKELLSKAEGGRLKKLGYWVLSYVPMVGTLATATISFNTTYNMLQSILNDLENDAQNVLCMIRKGEKFDLSLD